MGYNKITNLLGKLDKDEIPKFTTVKWIEIFDQSNGTYNLNKDIRFKTAQIRSDLCNFNEAYFVVTGKVNATNANLPGNINPPNGIVYAPNGIEDAQDLDIVMPMYNLLNYSTNFKKTTGSFWSYYPDKPNSSTLDVNDRERVFYQIRNSESFNYKTKLASYLPDDNNIELENVKIIVPLKNLRSYIFKLNFLMINSEIELILKWSRNCVLTERVMREEKALLPGQGNIPPGPRVVGINTPSDLKFNITDCKLYAPVVTLQEKYENKLFESLKNGIDINFEWKRYRKQII